jgi:putative endonuclease
MSEKYYTYVLFSDKFLRLYIGQTDNLKRRLKQHLNGKVNSTQRYLPYRLIYFEMFESRSDAVRREKELKKTSGRKFVSKYINNIEFTTVTNLLEVTEET